MLRTTASQLARMAAMLGSGCPAWATRAAGASVPAATTAAQTSEWKERRMAKPRLRGSRDARSFRGERQDVDCGRGTLGSTRERERIVARGRILRERPPAGLAMRCPCAL